MVCVDIKHYVYLLTSSGFQSPGEIKRREMELDPQVSPEEIMSMEVELGYESWIAFASGCSSTAVQRTLSLSVTLPSTAVETAIDDLRKSKGLHSVNAYRHGLYIVISPCLRV